MYACTYTCAHIRTYTHAGKFFRRASTEMDGASKRGSLRNEPVSVPAPQNSPFRNATGLDQWLPMRSYWGVPGLYACGCLSLCTLNNGSHNEGSRHLGSSTAANWVSFDLNVSCSSCWGYSLVNTLKLKKNEGFTCIYVSLCLCVCVSVCLYVCVSVCRCVSMSVYIYM